MNDPSYIGPQRLGYCRGAGLHPEPHAIEQSSMFVEKGVGIRWASTPNLAPRWCSTAAKPQGPTCLPYQRRWTSPL